MSTLYVKGVLFILAAIYLFLSAVNFWYYPLMFPDYMIHESGHILFRPLGHFIATLGGSFIQVAVPLFTSFYFLRQGSGFASAIFFVWAGGSLHYVGWYVSDAKKMGSDYHMDSVSYHDWSYILNLF